MKENNLKNYGWISLLINSIGFLAYLIVFIVGIIVCQHPYMKGLEVVLIPVGLLLIVLGFSIFCSIKVIKNNYTPFQLDAMGFGLFFVFLTLGIIILGSMH